MQFFSDAQAAYPARMLTNNPALFLWPQAGCPPSRLLEKDQDGEHGSLSARELTTLPKGRATPGLDLREQFRLDSGLCAGVVQLAPKPGSDNLPCAIRSREICRPTQGVVLGAPEK